MSDVQTPDDLDDDTPSDQDRLKGLRAAAEAGKAATAENAQLKREVAFMRAGIDVTSALGKMMLKSWEGDIDDTDAIKAGAIEIGLLTPPPDADEIARQAAEAQLAGAQQATAGAPVVTSTGNEGTHPREGALAEYQTEITTGGVEPEEARGNAMAKVIAAGIKGDRRVIYDPAAHHQAGLLADRAETRRPT